MQNILQISSQTAIYAQAGNPLEYPCEIPTQPYLLLGEEAIPIGWQWPHAAPTSLVDGTDVSAILAQRGSVPLEERIPQIAFGANRDLRNIAWKFLHYAASDATVSTDVVVVPALIDDADVVACNLGYWGYVYAALLLHRPPQLVRPYLVGTKAPVTVLFLDQPQMNAIHESEGVIKSDQVERPPMNCDVALTEVTLMNGLTLQAQLYALALPFLSFDCKSPVPFSRVNTVGRRSHFETMDQVQLFESIVAHLGLELDGMSGKGLGRHVANLIRQSRLEGDSNDVGARLYTEIRQHIIDELSLRDGDGVIRCGNSSLPNLLPTEVAWKFQPTLGKQLAST